ncbi:MAG: hypothetical protein AB1586_00840 [Pseudomonadota bacterium]|jgi:hypothetical protein
MNKRVTEIETVIAYKVDGETKAHFAKKLAVDASLHFENVRQEGSHLVGDIVLKVDMGFSSIEAREPFDLDTGLGNPIVVDLSTITLPIIGDVEVVAEFSYDIPQRQLSVVLTLAGIITLAKVTTHF